MIWNVKMYHVQTLYYDRSPWYRRGNDSCIVRWYLPCVFHCHVFSFMSHIFILTIVIIIHFSYQNQNNVHYKWCRDFEHSKKHHISNKNKVGHIDGAGLYLSYNSWGKCITNWMVRKDTILLFCCHLASLFPGGFSSILSTLSPLFYSFLSILSSYTAKLLFHQSPRLHSTVTTRWLDSDGAVTIVNCRQHSNQLCSHCAAGS